MNDFSKIIVGVAGTGTGVTLTLAHVAQGAAIAASVATAVFMGVSALEKLAAWRERRRASAQLRFPFAER